MLQKVLFFFFFKTLSALEGHDFPNASHINVAISVNRVFIAHKGKVLKELKPVFKKEETSEIPL